MALTKPPEVESDACRSAKWDELAALTEYEQEVSMSSRGSWSTTATGEQIISNTIKSVKINAAYFQTFNANKAMGLLLHRRLNMTELEQIDEYTYKLPDGSYFDNEDFLRSADGEKLPDGLYQNSDGELISYEGNFLSMSQK